MVTSAPTEKENGSVCVGGVEGLSTQSGQSAGPCAVFVETSVAGSSRGVICSDFSSARIPALHLGHASAGRDPVDKRETEREEDE